MPSITMSLDQWVRDIVALRERVKKLEQSRDDYAQLYLRAREEVETLRASSPTSPKGASHE